MFRFDTSISSAVETTGETSHAPAIPASGPLAPELLDRMHRYWQAANYLTIGQIYLQENPLLREALRPSTLSRVCWSLGNIAWPQSDLRSFEPADYSTRREYDLSCWTGARWAGGDRERVSRRHLLGGVSESEPGHRRDAPVVSPFFDARRCAESR